MSAAARFSMLRPASTPEAVACAVSMPGARWVAGGTALQLEWHRGVAAPEALIALDGIPALRGVSSAEDRIHIGALTALGELERDRAVATLLPPLHAAILAVAAPSIRHLATLGGNVAARNGCLLPALLALDATLLIRDAAGLSRHPLDAWLASAPRPGALIEAVELPALPPHCRWVSRKIGRRAAFTPSVIGVAGLLETDAGTITRVRLAVGGGIVVPRRLVEAEAALLGRNLAAVDWRALRSALAAQIIAPDDAFRSGRYRRLAASHALVWGLGGSVPLRSPRSCPPP